ncbi:MAG: hypothetical protein QOF48_2893 [Verrucomicrobiota bacterium]|jgi:hypothetical protein
MSRLVILVALARCLFPGIASGAISVGITGSATLTFDTPPAAAEWSTYSSGGDSSTVTTASQLDAGIQALSAASITNPLPVSPLYPPSEAAFARWNSNRQLLQTRPTANAFTVLMATLKNDSGRNQPILTFVYDRGAVTESLTGPEPVRGQRVYYSITGAPGTWQVIPELSIDSPGVAVVALNLMNWQAGKNLYLLWADDNSSTDTDGASTIDNFSVRTVTVDGPVLEIVGPAPGAVFYQGSTIPLTAYARFFGTMTNCAFFADGAPVAVDTAPRFGTTGIGAYLAGAIGTPRLTAIGKNSSGNSITSAVVQISVQQQVAPRLNIALVNGEITELSWPLSSSGYVLESTPALGSSAWETVDEPDNQFGGFHRIYVNVTHSWTFFRLRKP